MINQPLVSVLMTAYNREQFIADAIESVLAQTYTNFELIIVDDCSIDNTVEIVKQYARINNRIKLFENEINLGDYPNRNKAASYASGELFKYLDSDDIIYPNTLKIMVEYYLLFPNVGFIFSDYLNQDNSKPYPILYSPYESYYQHFLKSSLFYAGPGGALITRKVFVEAGGFSTHIHISDTELWMKISLKYSILKIQNSLIWWRTHEHQESIIESRNYNSTVSRHNMSIKYLEESCLSENEKKNAKSIVKKIMARRLFFLLGTFKFSKFYSIYKKVHFNFVDLFLAFSFKNRWKKIFNTHE